MSSQIVLETDPSGLVGPFAMNTNVTSICLNASDLLAQQADFRQLAIQLAYFCLVVASVIGFIAGYYFTKRRYGDI